MAPPSQHAHRGAALAPIARVREFYRIARRRWGFVKFAGAKVFFLLGDCSVVCLRRCDLIVFLPTRRSLAVCLRRWPFLDLLVVY